jgi:NAD(P)H-binding
MTTRQLPGTDAARHGTGDADLTVMIAAHDAFRRDLNRTEGGTGMQIVISESGLDWALVRATRLVNRAGTGRYRVSPDFPPPHGRTIARADVAHFIATALTENAWLHAAPAVAY